MKHLNIYRILDANGNRVCEGLRVAEDISRFFIESPTLSKEFKGLRHRVRLALLKVGTQKLLSSRDSDRDIGADRKALPDKSKQGMQDLYFANCRRAEEGLRVMEEIGRIVSPSLSRELASARFELYTLEKEGIQSFPKVKWKNVDLYVLTDSGLSKGHSLEYIVKETIKGGTLAVQLREPQMSIKQKITNGNKIRAITQKSARLFIVNDRPDLAIQLEADGLHIGQDDYPVKEARKLIGADMVLGVSTHSLEQAKRAVGEGADYISVGPIYPTQSKTDALPAVGIRLLEQVRGVTPLPIVAIGGINISNVMTVVQAGADSIAVISAVVSADKVCLETQKLVKAIQKVKTERNKK